MDMEINKGFDLHRQPKYIIRLYIFNLATCDMSCCGGKLLSLFLSRSLSTMKHPFLITSRLKISERRRCVVEAAQVLINNCYTVCIDSTIMYRICSLPSWACS